MVVTGPFRNFQTVIAMDPITREIGTSALELDNYTIVDVSNILQPLIMMYLKKQLIQSFFTTLNLND